MDPELYKAILTDTWYLSYLQKDTNQLETQLTPNKNTILHIAALFGSTVSVKKILKTSPSLLIRENIKGQTPLHIAAVEGHCEIAHALIESARTLAEELESGDSMSYKHMVRMTNRDGDTALHEAVRYYHLDVVKLLVEEDLDFSYPPNKSEETPLYIAAEEGLNEFVDVMLKTGASLSYRGPCGRTALHAAVIFGYEKIMKQLLNRYQDLSKQADAFGWTPLHYAARFGNEQIVQTLLDLDTSLAYLTADEDDKKTALHIATSRGHIEIMNDIMSRCPDCWEMVNSKGQNILHIAIENEKSKVIRFILTQPYLDSLVNQKDNNGNTPLHVLAASPIQDLAPHLLFHERAKYMAFNNEGMTPLDLYKDKTLDSGISRMAFKKRGVIGQRNFISKDKEDEKVAKEELSAESGEGTVQKLKNLANTNLIVATLIAIVSFAAGFTLPDGYDGNAGSNQGKAVLSRKAAFRAFIIANAIAMMSSSCALFIYVRVAGSEDMRTLTRYQESTVFLLSCAEGAMMVAFITGIYVALADNSLGLAITVCCMGCFFFLIDFIDFEALLRRRYSAITHW